MTNARPPQYSPFPDFESWDDEAVSFSDVDGATRRFASLKERVSREALDIALDRALRAAAVDTNAIEGVFTTDRGFTRTVAARSGAWEQMLDQRGPGARPAFEDTLAGFELIFDHMTGRRPVTEMFIRELHATMLRSQDTHSVYTEVGGQLVRQQRSLRRGEYKDDPNSPTRTDGSLHPYAPPELTRIEMGRLVDELQSDAFNEAHPVSQAAYAHYAFVSIHPFSDGNGRVARALASVYLYRSPGVPLVIYNDQRTTYLDALESADAGHHHRFIRFIAERVTDTVNTLESELTAAMVDEPSAAELSDLFGSRSVSPELNDVAVRFKEMLHEGMLAELDRRAGEHQLPVKSHPTLIGTAPQSPEGYATMTEDLATTLIMTMETPMSLVVAWPVVLCARSSDQSEFDIIAVTQSGHSLGVYVRELMPTVSENLRQRMTSFCQVVYSQFLSRVAAEARAKRLREARDT